MAGLAVLLTLQSDPPKMTNKVQIDRRKDKNSNITLRLRWWFDGKREQLILGVRDDEIGRSYAKIVQKTITRDLDIGAYTGKHKYETPAKRKRKSKPSAFDEITAVELFQEYTEYRLQERGLSHSSTVRFKGIASKLNQLLGDKPVQKITGV